VPDTAERVLLPYLRKHGKKSVDLMVLSHAHPDHYKGLVGVARRLPVRELWHPAGAIEPFGEYQELLRLVEKSGGRVLGPQELCSGGDSEASLGLGHRRVFGVDVDILAPCPGPEGHGLNDESLVIRLHGPERRYLFTGDAERVGEARLLQRAKPLLAAEVLKVGHHGSATSTSREFLEAVHPQLAVISCGIRNRFGHPRPETLESLGASRVEVRRLDLEGGFSL
jgi:competence protein ComEC